MTLEDGTGRKTGGVLKRAKSEVSNFAMTTNEGALLTVREVAAILKVPVSWVYEHTRGNCREKLPYVKVGKYLRFFDADIANYLRAIRARNGGSRSLA
jgi:excisionase family DNA binding protein